MSDALDLAAIVEAAIGRPLDELPVTEALDLAERLRAIAEAVDGPGSATLLEAAELVERRSGVL